MISANRQPMAIVRKGAAIGCVRGALLGMRAAMRSLRFELVLP
jgi:hypothetical protein